MGKGNRKGKHIVIDCIISSSARVFLLRINYMDTCAFQGQWKEHVVPLLQWRSYTGECYSVCMLY